MNAIISGSAGVAVLVDGGSLFSIDIDRLEEIVPRRAREVPYLFGDAQDQQFVEGVDPGDVKRLLDEAWRGAEALELSLILMDGELSDETRELAATELEEALATKRTLEQVEAVLWSRPLPPAVSIDGTIALCRRAGAKASGAMLDRVSARQGAIGQVWEAFEGLPEALFGEDAGDKARARATLVRAGASRELVAAHHSGTSVKAVAVAVLARPEVRALRNHRAIIDAWILCSPEVHTVYTRPVIRKKTGPHVARWISIAAVLALGGVAAAFAVWRPEIYAAFAVRKSALLVEPSGCDMVHAPRASLACKLSTGTFLEGPGDGKPRRLRLWITTEPGTEHVQVQLDHRRVPTTQMQPLPGAERGEVGPLEVEVDEGASELEVTARSGWVTSEYRLPLLNQEPTPDQARFDDGLRLREEGKLEDAERVFEELTARSDPALRARATGRLARLAYRDPTPSRAIRLAYAAAAADAEAGLVSDRIADTFFLVVVMIDAQHDLEAAGRLLDGIEPALDEAPVGRALYPYYRAYLDCARGDLSNVLDLLETSATTARRLGLASHLRDVYQKRVEVLELLGRYDGVGPDSPAGARWGDRVEDLLEALRDPRLAPRSPCAQAKLANSLGWLAILSGHPGPEARTDLETALQLFSTGCDRAPDRANTLTNLAQVEIAAGRWDDAEGYLAQARREDPTPQARFAADRSLASGRAALLGRRPWDALDDFKKAAELSETLELPVAIAARFGIGEANEDIGDLDAAVASYDAADTLLNHWSALVPAGAGRSMFVDVYEHGTRRYLDLLLRRAENAPPSDSGPAQRAACVARRSRARVWALAEWQHLIAGRQASLDRDLLSGGSGERARGDAMDTFAGGPIAPACEGPDEDEALLVYHPLLDGQWAGFAVTRDRTMATRFRFDPAAPDLGEKVFGPFDAVLGGKVRRIRLLAAGPMASLDLHRLVFRGHELADEFAVSYGVDVLGRRRAEAQGKTALLVAILGEDLKAADREADSVQAALEAAGWKVLRRDGESATVPEILRLLREEDFGLFHYIGHGSRRGPDASDGYLRLAGNGKLRLSDVLSLPQAPQRVILSTCEGDAAGDDTMGIGSAFVISGATIAVAFEGQVKDSHVAAINAMLYGRFLNVFLRDPATALRETMSALRKDQGTERVVFPTPRVLMR